MPYLIGLTGQTGAGKTHVGTLLRQHNCEVIDCDRISREIYLPGSAVLERLVERFGAEILLPDGLLDRGELAHRAFSTPEGVQALNGITHPAIMATALGRAEAAMKAGRHAVLDAAALFESGGDGICHFTIAVIAPAEERRRRILSRDGLDEAAANERMRAQRDESFYTERADYTIRNYAPYDLNEELQPVFDRLG